MCGGEWTIACMHCMVVMLAGLWMNSCAVLWRCMHVMSSRPSATDRTLHDVLHEASVTCLDAGQSCARLAAQYTATVVDVTCDQPQA